MIGLLCKRALQKRRYSAKETYNFKEPTNRSHPIMHTLIYHGVCVSTLLGFAQEVCMCVCVFVNFFVYIILMCVYIHICKFVYNQYIHVCIYTHAYLYIVNMCVCEYDMHICIQSMHVFVYVVMLYT